MTRLTGLRAALVNAGMALGAVALSLLLAEITVRWMAPQQLIVKRPDVWQPLATLGWTHRPNVRTDINTGERTVSVFTDHEGFRVGEAGRIVADRRVLLLGDSFMEAFQVEYEQSVAGLLQQSLPASLGGPVSIRNTAVGGWGPNQYRLQARRLLDRENYDAVVVALYLGNDIARRRVVVFPPRQPDELHSFEVPRSLSGGELTRALLYPVNDLLETRSQLFILFKHRARTALMRMGLTAAYFPPHFRRDEAGAGHWGLTAGICREIVDLARQSGTPTLVVLIPTSYQVDASSFQRYVRGFGIDAAAVDIEQPNRSMAAALAGRQVDFLDVSPDLAREHANGARLYGDVDTHLTPAGHEVIARALEPVLTALIRKDPT